jgi:hypothetical protein
MRCAAERPGSRVTVSLNWRMALVGSVTTYDADGNALTTLRYAADANTDRDAFAERIAADVYAVLGHHPGIPVVCVQDGAEDLHVLPDKIRECATNSPFYHLTDFPHLMGYLADVVKDCELSGDPDHLHEWYRQELIHDDKAIERIYINLGRAADRSPATIPARHRSPGLAGTSRTVAPTCATPSPTPPTSRSAAAPPSPPATSCSSASSGRA